VGRQIKGPRELFQFDDLDVRLTLLETNGIEVVSAILYNRPTRLEEGDKRMANWLRTFFGGGLFRGVQEESIDQVIDVIVEKLRPDLYGMENDGLPTTPKIPIHWK
jgi:hypothetical protein